MGEEEEVHGAVAEEEGQAEQEDDGPGEQVECRGRGGRREEGGYAGACR